MRISEQGQPLRSGWPQEKCLAHETGRLEDSIELAADAAPEDDLAKRQEEQDGLYDLWNRESIVYRSHFASSRGLQESVEVISEIQLSIQLSIQVSEFYMLDLGSFLHRDHVTEDAFT